MRGRRSSDSRSCSRAGRGMTPTGSGPLAAQSEVLGAVNDASAPADVVVCAAGAMPGDLHKLWRTRDPKGYHVEYGYSCMGYEIAGGLGVKMAAPEREVYVMCGDGSYGFGTHYRFRKNDSIGLDSEEEPGDVLPADLATNAQSLGAHVIRTQNIEDLKKTLGDAKVVDRTVVIHIPVDRYEGVPDYDSFWDVPVAEVSEMESVAAAREEYATNTESERRYL